MGDTPKTIKVGPDKPCLLANRLANRLVRDGLIPSRNVDFVKCDRIVEALADEIHQDIIDGTLRMGT